MTPAEARLAAGLAAGKSLAEIAEEAGLSIHTARWTLKRIFARTGARRQSELVSMLLCGPARLRGPDQDQDGP